MDKAGFKGVFSGSAAQEHAIDWELRPGGMVVQKRDPDAVAVVQGPMIKVKVSHGLFSHDVTIPAQATFGDLKKLLVQDTGLKPNEQRLLFRGKQKEDSEWLHVAGVKDKAKIILVEDPASRERRLDEMRKQEQIAKACKAVAGVRSEVDKLAGQISELEASISTGFTAHDSDFTVLTELLMRQLLKLDTIQADGEAKALRRTEVQRVQSFVEAVDGMKLRNSKAQAPSSSVVVTTQWETFDSGMGSLTAPPPSSIPTITDWERFD
ncbi:hypothetical protein MPTK1_6g15890 [Marchantia polymorpha subsp. ruderalis]|uniref:Ubiquitin-like domain-containing protein n=2 Tax=Marchantia polymorpha TaxID=3197 RepID=A0AAF6BSI4_MARPO|nr:hypothetical protein MARPO_0056s0101 [Marchantia polymorpha]BBN14968.1 hypothetical protein Mp_6g15890 [Marchantia polymorpha subsp. ruderalis]|eukprot:PTQ37652.1 hypothetical protein MARPO_0056s0101 [Marchantia polymorpha]